MPDIPAAVHIVVGAVGHQELIPLHVGQIQPAVGLKALNVLQRNIGAVLAVIVVAGHHGGGVGQFHLDLAHSKISVSVGGSLSVLGVHIHIDVLKAEGGIAGFRGTGVLQLNLIEAACSLFIEQGLKLLVAEVQGLLGAAVVQIQLQSDHILGVLLLQSAHGGPVDASHPVGLQITGAVLKEQSSAANVISGVLGLVFDHIFQCVGCNMVLKRQNSIVGSVGGVHSGQGPDGQGAHHHTEHHEKGQRLLAHSCQHAHSPSSRCAGSCKYAAAGRAWRRFPPL